VRFGIEETVLSLSAIAVSPAIVRGRLAGVGRGAAATGRIMRPAQEARSAVGIRRALRAHATPDRVGAFAELRGPTGAVVDAAIVAVRQGNAHGVAVAAPAERLVRTIRVEFALGSRGWVRYGFWARHSRSTREQSLTMAEAVAADPSIPEIDGVLAWIPVGTSAGAARRAGARGAALRRTSAWGAALSRAAAARPATAAGAGGTRAGRHCAAAASERLSGTQCR